MVHLKEMLQIATIVTTTTEVVARRLKVTDKNAIIPNYYDANNSSWQNAHFRHKTINIGWCGTTTHRADFSLCENAVKRILTEYPNTKIVIGGDDEIYARFREFPQSQRQFLPFMQYDDYPLMLAQFDILLAPLQDDWFNQAKSDIKLVEAGAVGIPVVVSPISFYKLWPGVVVAEGSDDWYNGIKGLVTDEETRKTFGQWIRDRVLAERSSEVIAKRWIEVLDGLPKD
jgi:glycosyltransferase involved in cell wall biosynthesis